jgi:hypothetical protein
MKSHEPILPLICELPDREFLKSIREIELAIAKERHEQLFPKQNELPILLRRQAF